MSTPRLVIVKLIGGLVDHRYLDGAVFQHLWARLPGFFEEHAESAALEADIAALRAEADEERASGRADFVHFPSDVSPQRLREAAVTAVRTKLQESRHTPAVVSVCGHLMLEAFAAGTLRPQVYADCRAALQRWSASDGAVAVYDGLSEPVQREWLRAGPLGDLTPHVTRFLEIDERTAREGSAFAVLAQEVGLPAVVATDRTFDALAASRRGLDAVVLERGGVFGGAPHGLRVETNLLGV